MEQSLKWLHAWATLAQGLVGVLTLGFYQPSWGLSSARLLARQRWNQK